MTSQGLIPVYTTLPLLNDALWFSYMLNRNLSGFSISLMEHEMDTYSTSNAVHYIKGISKNSLIFNNNTFTQYFIRNNMM